MRLACAVSLIISILRLCSLLVKKCDSIQYFLLHSLFFWYDYEAVAWDSESTSVSIWLLFFNLRGHSSWAGSSSWQFWRPACSWWGSTPSTCCATFPRRFRSGRPCTFCGNTFRSGWRTCRRRTTSRSCSRRRSFRRGTCRCRGRAWRRTSGRGWSACWSWGRSRRFRCNDTSLVDFNPSFMIHLWIWPCTCIR